MYCKLVNGRLEAVRFPIGESNDIFTNDESILLEYGYKPVVYEETPELQENEYVTPIYTETAAQIIVSWEIHESTEATEADYLAALAKLGVNVDEED